MQIIEKILEKADPAPKSEQTDTRLNLFGFSRKELETLLGTYQIPSFRAKQIWHWLYTKGATDFAQMTTLAKPMQQRLSEEFVIRYPRISTAQESVDGTQKWLLGFDDRAKAEAECVFIPAEERGTLCISSQVGCTLNCKFCHTGTQAWVKNLDVADIVGQVVHAKTALNDWGKLEEGRALSNIVLMGMGEPLYNYDNVAKALHILMDGDGLSISKRKITLSTAGVVPLIERVGAELGVNLAISLHAVRDEVRDVIVPLNRKYPLKELLEACRNYPGATNMRRITYEYVMLAGVNDSDADAHELVRLLRDMPAKVNLIPFNPWPGAPYECSSNKRIQIFADIVHDGGLPCPVRTPRGRDILAACGQLKSDSVRKRASERSADADA
ncbi:MAG: 23S rRNA (adenine(2503)-C(2))-methyltransferase RlmN [Alphaproteobacteria bacterium]|jgi:23S rRNA (adenine2503-C2)-methyltransferase|nr:23S rRNA (adenine(2503)-C(2))-methyltransferase RlmN [Alphaproteobacteria bacterium]